MATLDLQPRLVGKLVELRPLHTDDWDATFAAASDPATWADHVKTERFRPDVFRSFFDSGLESNAALVITEKASGRIIGSSRYHDYKPALSEIEIGWTFLQHDFWGGRYNQEVKRLMLEHIFQFVETVVFWVASGNTRSQGAMRRIGGQLRDGSHAKTTKGVTTPYVVFEITREAFGQGPLATR